MKVHQKGKILIGIFVIFAVACAPIPQSYQPVIDTGSSGFSWNQYYKDLEECRSYAKQVSPANQAVGEAVVGSIFGAALGAILGSGFHSAGSSAGIGAGISGLTGAAHGAGNAIQEQKRIIDNCMRGRGYRVLN